MTIIDWDTIKYFTNTLNILFIYLIAANLDYDLFEKLVEKFFSFSIFNIFKDSIVGTYYKQYNELIISFCSTSNHNFYKENTFNIDKNNDRRVIDNNNN